MTGTSSTELFDCFNTNQTTYKRLHPVIIVSTNKKQKNETLRWKP